MQLQNFTICRISAGQKNTGRVQEEDSEPSFEGWVRFVLTGKENGIAGMRNDMQMELKWLFGGLVKITRLSRINGGCVEVVGTQVNWMEDLKSWGEVFPILS